MGRRAFGRSPSRWANRRARVFVLVRRTRPGQQSALCQLGRMVSRWRSPGMRPIPAGTLRVGTVDRKTGTRDQRTMKARPVRWRMMTRSDLVSVERIGDTVHPDYPEDAAVAAERLQLYPAGCLVLESESGVQGYAVSHPWTFGRPPPLNTRLGDLPRQANTFYIHDLALMPIMRGAGLGTKAVGLLVSQADLDGFTYMSLVAVRGALRFWQTNGFRSVEDEAIQAGLSTYGGGATLMWRAVP